MIQKLIGGMVVLLVGTTLLPDVSRAIRTRTNNSVFTSEVEKVPKKQTYEEYVQERLRVERLMK